MGLADVVTLAGPLPYQQVAGEYRRATVHVNLCPTGGLDKAVLEGMAAGVPSLVCNVTFDPLFGSDATQLIVSNTTPNAQTIAARLDRLLRTPAAERQALGNRLRQTVVARFGEQALAKRLAQVLQEVAAN